MSLSGHDSADEEIKHLNEKANSLYHPVKSLFILLFLLFGGIFLGTQLQKVTPKSDSPVLHKTDSPSNSQDFQQALLKQIRALNSLDNQEPYALLSTKYEIELDTLGNLFEELEKTEASFNNTPWDENKNPNLQLGPYYVHSIENLAKKYGLSKKTLATLIIEYKLLTNACDYEE